MQLQYNPHIITNTLYGVYIIARNTLCNVTFVVYIQSNKNHITNTDNNRIVISGNISTTEILSGL